MFAESLRNNITETSNLRTRTEPNASRKSIFKIFYYSYRCSNTTNAWKNNLN